MNRNNLLTKRNKVLNNMPRRRLCVRGGGHREGDACQRGHTDRQSRETPGRETCALLSLWSSERTTCAPKGRDSNSPRRPSSLLLPKL